MTDAERMILDLKASLAGQPAAFHEGLVTVPAEREVDHDALLAPARIKDILAWYDARLNAETDWRPALSIWMGWHFQAILPPLLAAAILLDRSPKLALHRVAFVISSDHKAERIRIAPEIDDLSASRGFDRFEPLISHYLTPLISLAARRAAITERVLWSNAGHVFERFLGFIEPIAADRSGYADARTLLASRNLADGSRNPLFEPVRYEDGQRLRKVCCMRYLFPDGKICTVCPLQTLPAPRSTVHD